MSRIKFGETDISDIKFSTDQISAVYLGASKVWENEEPSPITPTTATLNITSDLDIDLYFTIHSDAALTLNWGDGTIEQYTGTVFTDGYAVHATHSYAESGVYNATFSTPSGVLWSPGTTLPGNSTDITYGILGQWGKTNYPELTEFMFGINCRLNQTFAFTNCTGLIEIVIPETVTTIERGSFWNCTFLESMVFEGTGKAFADEPFGSNDSLVRVEVADLNTWLTYSFVNSTSTPFYGNQHNAVLYFGNTPIRHITIPSTVTSLSDGCFAYLETLEALTMNHNVISVGQYTFANCTGIRAVYCDSVSAWAARDYGQWSNSGPMQGGAALYENGNLVTTIALQSGITKIGNAAFNGCTSIRSILIPNNVTEIGINAFWASALETITFSNGLLTIGSGAFRRCTSLTSIALPLTLQSISMNAFSESGITSIAIPSSVTEIAQHAFSKCLGLTEVHLPATVQTVDNYIFEGCTSLINAEVASTSIGICIFDECTALEKVWLRSTIQSGGWKMCSDSNQNCILYLEPSSRPSGWSDLFDVHSGTGSSSKPYVRLSKVYNQTTSPF